MTEEKTTTPAAEPSAPAPVIPEPTQAPEPAPTPTPPPAIEPTPEEEPVLAPEPAPAPDQPGTQEESETPVSEVEKAKEPVEGEITTPVGVTKTVVEEATAETEKEKPKISEGPVIAPEKEEKEVVREVKVEDSPKESAPAPPEPEPAPPRPSPIPTPIQPTSVPTESFKTKFITKLRSNLVTAREKRLETRDRHLEKIMNLALKTQRVTNNNVEKLLGVSDRSATRYLKILTKQGRLIRFGKAQNIFYKPIIK